MTAAAEPFTLLNPGPVNVPAAVRRALADCPDRCHREPETLAMQTRVREKIAAVFGVTGRYEAALLTGSGTAAMEAMVLSVVGRGVLVVENGVYGERLAAIAEARGLPVERLSCGWTERPDPAAVEAALGDELDTIALVHHETTTGLLNDVGAVAEVARRTGRRLVVDSVSGLGGEAFDFDAWAPDAVCCTANKCIEGLPGVSFVLVREGTPLARRSVYLDLATLLATQRRADTPFTPAVQVLAAFEAALDVLAEETVAARGARYARAAARIRRALASHGLALYLPEALRSRTITTAGLPEGVDYERLHDALRAEGFVIYAGPGRLREEAFRVANMGQLSGADLDRFEAALARVLA